MRTLPLIVLFAPLLFATACRDIACDPGQIEYHNTCITRQVVGGADAGAEVDADPGAPPTDMGKTCTATTDCTVDTDLCAILPGDPTGFCTRSNCLDDPSICPSGWSCIDLRGYVAGLSLCAR